MNQQQRLHKQIMRRVYLAFLKRILTHELTLQAVLFALALFIFAKLVHVASVVHNLLQVQVGKLPAFAWNTVAQGEVLTLMAIGVMVFVALNVPWRLYKVVLPKLHLA